LQNVYYISRQKFTLALSSTSLGYRVTYGIQLDLHTSPSIQIYYSNSWYSISLKPNSTNHNQLLINYMGRVGISESRGQDWFRSLRGGTHP